MRTFGHNGKIRFAVVGLGHIAQSAVLPAFDHVKNAVLTGLVSGDAEKRQTLGQRYGLSRTWSYDEYDDCLKSGEVDAVYIALPNDMHREYTVRAAHAGVSVLCEKPMAVTSADCAEMISACEQNNVQLMVGYRLHFEPANLRAIEIVKSGRLGDPRAFQSIFSMQVKPGNIRLQKARGGGPVYDIGIYCINAARYLFQDEPVEVCACSAEGTDDRFREVPEMTGVTMRFPQGRIANFVCSFNGPSVQQYSIMGTQGILRLDPAYDYKGELKHHLRCNGETYVTGFPMRDQFAGELEYFADCLLSGRTPEPDGWEGLIDVQIIEAVQASAISGLPVRLSAFHRRRNKPDLSQEMAAMPAGKQPGLVRAEAPTMDE